MIEGPRHQHPWKVLLLALLLAILTLAAYRGLAGCGFLTYDDHSYVYKNPQVLQGLTWRSIRWAFTSTVMHFYSPVTLLSHMLDVNLFGLSPAGHHVMSLAFHILNTIILFLLFLRWTGALWRSWMVAALFALHPMHVEAVAWIAERKELLSALLGLLALWAYYAYVKRKSPWAYLGSLALLGLGLLTKPMLVTFPFLLLLLDIWPLGRWPMAGKSSNSKDPAESPPAEARFDPRVFVRNGWPLVLEKLPFFLLIAAVSGVTFWLNKTGGAINNTKMLPLSLRLANVVYAYGQYIAKLFFPLRLSVFYPHPSRSMPWALVAVWGGLILLVTVLFALALPRRPYLLIGWLWFLGTTVPVSGIVQIGSLQSYADRYTYFTYIGLFFALVWGISDLFKGKGKLAERGLAVASALALLGLGAQTARQVGYWKDTETLFLHAESVVGKENYLILGQLGICRYWDHSDIEGAKTLIKQAISLNPGYWPNWSSLGYLLALQGRLPEAVACLQQALKVGATKDYHVNFNLGKALFGQGKVEEALGAFRSAQALAPDSVECARYVVDCLVRLGRMPEAEAAVTGELLVNENDPGFLAQLASIQAAEGKSGEWESTAARVLAAGKNSPKAQYTLAYALLAPPVVPAEALQRATSLAEQACEGTHDQDPAMLQACASAYDRLGRKEDAERLRRMAASLTVNSGAEPVRGPDSTEIPH